LGQRIDVAFDPFDVDLVHGFSCCCSRANIDPSALEAQPVPSGPARHGRSFRDLLHFPLF